MVRIGFTTNSSVIASNGETTFTIRTLSGQLQFGASVRITLTAVGPMKGAGLGLSTLFFFSYYSKIDLSKGYWQVPVAEADIAKTAFITPDGSYEFLKMPFE